MLAASILKMSSCLAWTFPQLSVTTMTRASRIAMSADPATLKDSLLSIIAAGDISSLPLAATQQQELAETILGLSACNPTPMPAKSNLLNGVWEVAYSQTPGGGLVDSPTRPLALSLYATGFSPAVLAQGLSKLPFGAASIGKVRVTITSMQAGQPRVTTATSVSLFGAEQTLELRANLLARSDVCLREEFVEASLLGQRSLLPGPLAYSRQLYITYLDDELCVMRDDGGLANVLRRVELFPTAASPSVADEDASPGAG